MSDIGIGVRFSSINATEQKSTDTTSIPGVNGLSVGLDARIKVLEDLLGRISTHVPSTPPSTPDVKSPGGYTHVDFIDTNDYLLDDVISRRAYYSSGDKQASSAWVHHDIFVMVDEIEKETGTTMSDEDILTLMKDYNSSVDLNDVGKGVDGRIQKQLVEQFAKNPHYDSDVQKCAQEVGVDPNVFAALVKKMPNQPLSPDQMKALAENQKFTQIDPSKYLYSEEVEGRVEELARETGANMSQLFKVVSDICNQTKQPLSSGDINNIAWRLVTGGTADAITKSYVDLTLADIARR